ncbi:hypothetical protein CC1G_15179 [Coprinopsis cinerea okayama7|uniref:Uncharacterized protein n=1 Tax=Coprinopsis cinerea (strain Okayama-7 / 130 / ATCC MYA-4618 / FGSC 9003) TaxID=240176 RepID=D6RPI8_COPC7|nr:hypothetical protein CC1G_15179 [Coprinopsis cinerea okayama7\|eukprot:XP_002910540.1 hypothetical protein CC1G_15179 [Coprinopsis cinerea okayama7\
MDATGLPQRGSNGNRKLRSKSVVPSLTIGAHDAISSDESDSTPTGVKGQGLGRRLAKRLVI